MKKVVASFSGSEEAEFDTRAVATLTAHSHAIVDGFRCSFSYLLSTARLLSITSNLESSLSLAISSG